ncbi:MAG TPA: RNA polymerase sigma factor RpoD/SigA [Solirubrobacteraceae bacterium]|nr:RNA polymerase sigma factor RpoD/SigA [Solirubrobacteraceae bacterium]HTX06956.1 RNA polymerase sigma factor RpoD/SigA [Solirubrobacteraceae bacterium]HUA44749.1 RNA polymerase sigma factor RpoD/SigA [Solirubrobacteraceae bacterium]
MTESSLITSDDQVGTLLRRAMSRPLLSAAEETDLAIQIEQGDLGAKERMIESNLRLVVSLARTYRGRRVPMADLVQEGTIGLIRAVERFDHRHGVRFSTYAAWWIRRSLRDAVAAAQLIRIPPRATRQLAAVRRAEDELRHSNLGAASTAAVADRTGLSVESVRSLQQAARVTASLDEPVGEEDTPLRELLADHDAADPPERAVAGEESARVRRMLRLLPQRHRDVVIRRYGLGQDAPQSHEQIGAWLGVGEERSRQLEREALRRLRTIATAQAA